MTHRTDVAHGRDLLARWCTLAEQRLQHLTELFESGRWRRYYSEVAFLQNIQEARTAVETWRALSARGSLAGHPRSNLETRREVRSSTPKPQPEPVVAEAKHIPAKATPAASIVDMASLGQAMEIASEPVPDVPAITQRYPLLRNALYT